MLKQQLHMTKPALEGKTVTTVSRVFPQESLKIVSTLRHLIPAMFSKNLFLCGITLQR